MKSLQKIKVSFLVSFFFLSLSVFSQDAKTINQKVLFENINSLQQYVSANLNLNCGNDENLNFELDSSSCFNDSIEEREERIRCKENMIIYHPYREYIPGSYYSETKIELLDIEEIIFSLQVTTVGNRYEYYECTELYYFRLSENTWEQITY